MAYIIDYNNCERYEDNRDWHSNKVFETQKQAIDFLYEEGFNIQKTIFANKVKYDTDLDGNLLYYRNNEGFWEKRHTAVITEVEYVPKEEL